MADRLTTNLMKFDIRIGTLKHLPLKREIQSETCILTTFVQPFDYAMDKIMLISITFHHKIIPFTNDMKSFK